MDSGERKPDTVRGRYSSASLAKQKNSREALYRQKTIDRIQSAKAPFAVEINVVATRRIQPERPRFARSRESRLLQVAVAHRDASSAR